jgi:hypothetical protein
VPRTLDSPPPIPAEYRYLASITPDPRPLGHDLWPGFKAHVIASSLNPLILVSSVEFYNHGRELWATYLAGAVASGWEEPDPDQTPVEIVISDEIAANSVLRL